MYSTHVFISLLAVLNAVYGVSIKGKKDADGVEEAPINGHWGDWVTGECPVSCGGGSRKNYRECNSPKPQNGGAYCTGIETFEEGCNPWFCPVDGGWNDWVVSGDCSEPCGGGVRTMSRECNNPPPRHGGAQCSGPRVQLENCNQQECPVDCIWGEWEYGDCSEDCGWGVAPIMRIKVQVEMFGGRCEGESSGQRECHLRECDPLPVDCEWSEWIHGTCSVTCGGGIQWNKRVWAVVAENGGHQCEGNNLEVVICNPEACPPIDCEWGEWIHGTCSVTCGEGTQLNTRVVAVAAENGGHQCEGDDDEIVNCNAGACPPIAEPCVDTWSGYCGTYVSWACTDNRYPWFADYCRKTCGLC